jgi:hypothetical protein
MPFKFWRKSASPDVVRIRNIAGRRIPSLSEIDTSPDLAFNAASHQCSDSRSFSSFKARFPTSVSSPNLNAAPALKHLGNDRRPANFVAAGLCPICSLPFGDQSECTVPRILPCLHTFCTGCLQRAENFLVLLSKSGSLNRPTRYSWRRRSARASLGSFLCPFCHTETSVLLIEGIRNLPINRFILPTPPAIKSDQHFNRQRF